MDNPKNFKEQNIELLAISFSYPPLVYPRSIQVARLLRHLDSSTVVVCADEKGYPRDATLEPHADAFLEKCLRVPFAMPRWRAAISAVAARLRAPVWHKLPDYYRSWTPQALKATEAYMREARYRPNVLVTFGSPMSDHLLGWQLARRHSLPWVAHFSDPWVDNPFNRYDRLTSALNFLLERKVVGTADRLVFTSLETLDLVMAKYPKSWAAKGRVLPHAFDKALYPAPALDDKPKLTLRYLGELYGHRTATPLFAALARIAAAEPSSLSDVQIELIGLSDEATLNTASLASLPAALVTVRRRVSYRESLALMTSADGLLVIDAPAEKSVFLPAKLVDYIGSGRPILGITPPGTAADLIRRLGGWVADPSDSAAVINVLNDYLAYLRQRRRAPSHLWGAPDVRRTFEAPRVAPVFANILREVAISSAPCENGLEMSPELTE